MSSNTSEASTESNTITDNPAGIDVVVSTHDDLLANLQQTVDDILVDVGLDDKRAARLVNCLGNVLDGCASSETSDLQVVEHRAPERLREITIRVETDTTTARLQITKGDARDVRSRLVDLLDARENGGIDE